MNKQSLEKELKQLKAYLKKVQSSDESLNSTDAKIISHTLVGMIMSIHNLIKTGAYDQLNNNSSELFDLIQEARNSAIHYGYFTDLNNIMPEANNIVSNIPNSLKSNFANTIPNLKDESEVSYYQLAPYKQAIIEEVVSPIGFYRFKTLNSEQELYIKKEDLIIVTNHLNNKPSYLIKDIDNNILFYKDNPKATTIKVSLNSMLESKFLKQFQVDYRKGKIDSNIKKLLTFLEDNPYKNGVITYKYNNRAINETIQNVLKNFFYNRTIEEKIINGNFDIKDYDKAGEVEIPNLSNLPIKELCEKASLSDLFYMELYIKRYRRYYRLKEELEKACDEQSLYTKQSLLINLFEVGASSFSDKFLTFDRKKELYSLYYDYKKTRNELAHSAITDIPEKDKLIRNLEAYTDAFYSVISKIYKNYLKEKSTNNKSKLPPTHQIDPIHEIIYNKTSKLLLLPHTGKCRIINDKKYLKLDCDNDSTYLEISGSLLSLDYNTMSSRECVIPEHLVTLVDIDKNSNQIKKSSYKLKHKEYVDIDTSMETLLQAQDFLKSYPQYTSEETGPIFCAITLLDKYGNPTHTEGLKNLIYRRLSQKIIPLQLLETSSLVISKDIDEPILILNKKKEIIAKVYLAHLEKENKTLTQYLKNEAQKNIEYGKLLEKDLKTNEITTIIKEGR